MDAVVHVIPAVGVNDVHIVVVAPTHWPRRTESEVVAAVCEAMAVIVTTVHVEAVPAAETAVVVRIVDPAVPAAVTTVVWRCRTGLRRVRLICCRVVLLRMTGRAGVLLRRRLGLAPCVRRLRVLRSGRLGLLCVRFCRLGMLLCGFGRLRGGCCCA